MRTAANIIRVASKENAISITRVHHVLGEVGDVFSIRYNNAALHDRGMPPRVRVMEVRILVERIRQIIDAVFGGIAAVMDEYRCVAREHIVRVGFSPSGVDSRLRCRGFHLAFLAPSACWRASDFGVDGNGDGNLGRHDFRAPSGAGLVSYPR
jgi:hypothetical protein